MPPYVAAESGTAMPALSARRLPLWTIVLVSVLLAGVVGWIDFNASEVQTAVLLLLLFAGVLGYLDPSRAWLVALLLGLSIAGTHVVASTAGLQPVSANDSPAATLLALIPAAIGAAIGAGARWLTRFQRT